MSIEILIGTSGYNYYHWRDKFYPKNLSPKNWLEFYVQYFNTVELNVTFYRLPFEAAFKSWYKRTPHNFKFVIKGSRFITHIKRLNDCEDPLKLLFLRASHLKNKLACVLWQMPPSFGYDAKRIKNFVNLLKKWPQYLYSFEFRNKSWFNEELFALFNKHNINLCIADSSSYPSTEIITSNFLYLRFHGGKILYTSEYSEKEIKKWSEKINKWKKDKKIIFAFFNNDAYGFAIKNALQLKKLLSG